MPKPLTYQELLPYATLIEKGHLQAIIKHGSIRKAAIATKYNRSTVNRAIKRVRLRAASRGHAPEFGLKRPLPENYHMRGMSELVDGKGNTRLTWYKSEKTAEDLANKMEELIEGLCERIEGQATPVSLPKPDLTDLAKDIAVIVPMGDPHIGLYAWAQEAETDFDCEIAERLTIGAVEYLVDISPEAEEFILINLGDFFHSDNVDNRTAQAGNALDVDGRWAKVQEIGFWIMIKCIDRALAKYPKITVHNAIGNHDEHTSQALSATLSAWYRNEPRVTIIRSASKFWYHQWGKCMIGVHHGHTTKLNSMALTMASHEPEMWGETWFRYIYMGHLHHSEKKEYPGAIVEQFRTLAPKDTWHWGNGNFISMRDMQAIIMHKKYGDVGRRICPVEYLDALEKLKV